MVEAAASLVEVAVWILMGVAELALVVLVASIRPWRYVFSPTFRDQVDLELKTRDTLYKVIYFGWGTLVLVASIAVMVGVWWFFSSLEPSEPPPPSKLETK